MKGAKGGVAYVLLAARTCPVRLAQLPRLDTHAMPPMGLPTSSEATVVPGLARGTTNKNASQPFFAAATGSFSRALGSRARAARETHKPDSTNATFFGGAEGEERGAFGETGPCASVSNER